MTLAEAQALFYRIYGRVNEDRFGSGPVAGVSSMWLRVVRHTGEVARGIRKEDDPLLICELPQLFCWYCAFCTKLGLDLEKVIWQFFPLICPTCYSEVCQCGPRKERDVSVRPAQKSPILLAEFGSRNIERKPTTLDDYVDMFQRIYGGHNEAAHSEGIFLHLMEELGEVAKLIHVLKRVNHDERRTLIDEEIASELADVFSWICKLRGSVTTRLERLHSYFRVDLPDMTLSSLIKRVYGRGCPECGLNECTDICPGWNSRLGGDQVVPFVDE